MRWRRDVRRFRPDPIDPRLIETLLALASHAPSVGLSQPWRFVLVETSARRAAVRENFSKANETALNGYAGERQARYARLKLEGLSQAPVHLAVCADEATGQGHGLGRQTMPETIRYSVVAAIQTLWLAARAEGLGVGWVSILDPEAVSRDARSACGLGVCRLSLPRMARGGARRSRARTPWLGAAELRNLRRAVEAVRAVL